MGRGAVMPEGAAGLRVVGLAPREGRFVLLDAGELRIELEVAVGRDRGRVGFPAAPAWCIERDGRRWRFVEEAGSTVAVATKPSVVRERFEVELDPATGAPGTWRVVRRPGLRRRWTVGADAGPVASVERQARRRTDHVLTVEASLAGGRQPPAAVLAWLVALVATDPRSGVRPLIRNPR